jgi:hypothetical protein
MVNLKLVVSKTPSKKLSKNTLLKSGDSVFFSSALSALLTLLVLLTLPALLTLLALRRFFSFFLFG